jgi:hypothetical protein
MKCRKKSRRREHRWMCGNESEVQEMMTVRSSVSKAYSRRDASLTDDDVNVILGRIRKDILHLIRQGQLRRNLRNVSVPLPYAFRNSLLRYQGFRFIKLQREGVN